MKIIKTLILLVAPMLIWGQSYDMVSFNIRYDNPKDGPDNWNNRKKDLALYIQDIRPAILGIQEGLNQQVEFLNENLKDYEYLGVGRDDGKTKGEYCAVFYDSNKLTLLASGTFWLSSQPDTISIGWDAALERICTFGLFEDLITKQQFWVFNTHFDHKGAKAREQSAALIIRKILDINSENIPVVLMGDLNATPQEPPIVLIKQHLNDARATAKETHGPSGTFNGFRDKTEDRRIDYIFTKDFLVHSCDHIDARTKNGRNLSDHLPVVVNIALKQ